MTRFHKLLSASLMLALLWTLTACASKPPVLRQVKPPAEALVSEAPLLAPDAGERYDSYLGYVTDRYYQCRIKLDAHRAFWAGQR